MIRRSRRATYAQRCQHDDRRRRPRGRGHLPEWTLNNKTELWVNSITQTNDGAYHHANWFFVPDDQFKLPDGTWTCSQNQFDELVAALQGGYLFALSTQSHDETQTLPAGAAIRIPPYSRDDRLRATCSTRATIRVTTTMHLGITTIPPPQVTAKLAPARIQYHDLNIDPTTQLVVHDRVRPRRARTTTFATSRSQYKLDVHAVALSLARHLPAARGRWAARAMAK